MNLGWGLILILIGIVFLATNLHWVDYSIGEFFRDFWPVALILVGLSMILNQSKRKQKFTFTKEDFSGKKFTKSFGDVSLKLDAIEAGNLEVRHGLGDVKLDLRNTKLTAGENLIEIAVGAGDVEVTLPQGTPFSADVTVGAGDIHLPGERREGLAQKAQFTESGYESASTKIKLHIKLGMGDVRVNR